MIEFNILTTPYDFFAQATKWSNDNQRVVNIGIFVVTLVFCWISGIFSALRRKPKFKLGLIDGPTFFCTYPIEKPSGMHEAHRTGIAHYLAMTNTGSAASSIVLFTQIRLLNLNKSRAIQHFRMHFLYAQVVEVSHHEKYKFRNLGSLRHATTGYSSCYVEKT
jgi:hypothetical protein